jgi:uncharacterized protein YndB with AHSA1/START domain
MQTKSAITENSKFIRAPIEIIFSAFTDPQSLAYWLAPGEMTAKVHNFDLRIGGGYTMSLFYPDSEKDFPGKTSGKEDRFTARFLEITPNKKIIEAINFDTSNPEFKGEMIMEVSFEEITGGTTVTILFKNIPPGIRPEDNEAGTNSSLAKLARHVEAKSKS